MYTRLVPLTADIRASFTLFVPKYSNSSASLNPVVLGDAYSKALDLLYILMRYFF